MKHDGDQFVDVARGFTTDQVQQPLGMHWSTDEAVAHHFGNLREPQNTVIYAKAKPSDIIKSGSKEHEKAREEHAIYSGDSIEQEATIRPGSKVLVTGIHKTNEKGRTRLRTYRKPREMTA